MRWVALWSAFEMAVAELWRNRTRTALTSLGILIGVASVIAMVGIGQGATAAIEAELKSFGSNMLMVQAGTGRGPHARVSARPFDLADAEAIAGLPVVAAVSPNVNAPVTLQYGGITFDSSATGASAGWLVVSGRTVEAGRMFSEGEERAAASSCLLGHTVRQELFGASDPVGARVQVGSATCTVIGLVSPLGENMMGMDQDNLVVLPTRFVQRRLLGSAAVGMILVSVRRAEDLDAAIAAIDALMRQRRHVTSDVTVDFEIADTREIAATLSGVTGVMTAFLAAVASVSLLVGGIGIMNIMLVSVTERTKEIGLRMAIGALESDIRTQFLVEAGVLASFGGAMGVITGLAATVLGAWIVGVPIVVNPAVVFGALGFSALMGVGFGWIPARRAARLEPIDALRQ